MKIVIQRVSRAAVTVDGETVSSMGGGFLLLVAVEREDTREDLLWCAGKVAGLRIFEDDAGKMNRDLAQVGGEILAVSQFTLVGSLRRGRRPSFEGAARPEQAEPMFNDFVDAEFAEPGGHDPRRAVDVVLQFRVGVQVPAPFGDLVMQVGDAVDDGHGSGLFLE